MKLSVVLLSLTIFFVSQHPQVHAGSVGVNLGFGRSSQPYGDALFRIRDRGVSYIKTFSINPDWLNEVEAVYSGVIRYVH